MIKIPNPLPCRRPYRLHLHHCHFQWCAAHLSMQRRRRFLDHCCLKHWHPDPLRDRCSATDSPPRSCSSLKSVLGCRLSSLELFLFKTDARLLTLLPKRSIVVTNNSHLNFTIDGSPITIHGIVAFDFASLNIYFHTIFD